MFSSFDCNCAHVRLVPAGVAALHSWGSVARRVVAPLVCVRSAGMSAVDSQIHCISAVDLRAAAEVEATHVDKSVATLIADSNTAAAVGSNVAALVGIARARCCVAHTSCWAAKAHLGAAASGVNCCAVWICLSALLDCFPS